MTLHLCRSCNKSLVAPQDGRLEKHDVRFQGQFQHPHQQGHLQISSLKVTVWRWQYDFKSWTNCIFKIPVIVSSKSGQAGRRCNCEWLQERKKKVWECREKNLKCALWRLTHSAGTLRAVVLHAAMAFQKFQISKKFDTLLEDSKHVYAIFPEKLPTLPLMWTLNRSFSRSEHFLVENWFRNWTCLRTC